MLSLGIFNPLFSISYSTDFYYSEGSSLCGNHRGKSLFSSSASALTY